MMSLKDPGLSTAFRAGLAGGVLSVLLTLLTIYQYNSDYTNFTTSEASLIRDNFLVGLNWVILFLAASVVIIDVMGFLAARSAMARAKDAAKAVVTAALAGLVKIAVEATTLAVIMLVLAGSPIGIFMNQFWATAYAIYLIGNPVIAMLGGVEFLLCRPLK